jgi:hypothetical protein
LKKYFSLNSWPDKSVCALNRFDTDRITKYEKAKIRNKDSRICQMGTFPDARRVIIVTGAVSGKRLKINEIVPFGLSMIALININGIIIGMMRIVVA